jgi:preprotein translocase subunit YajC
MEIALIYFAVLALAFFLLIVRPQRRRAQAHRQFVADLALGDEVVTSGGMYGTITALRDDDVELQIAPGTVIRVARMAIAQPAGPVAVEGAGSDTPEVDGPSDGRSDEGGS